MRKINKLQRRRLLKRLIPVSLVLALLMELFSLLFFARGYDEDATLSVALHFPVFLILGAAVYILHRLYFQSYLSTETLMDQTIRVFQFGYLYFDRNGKLIEVSEKGGELLASVLAEQRGQAWNTLNEFCSYLEPYMLDVAEEGGKPRELEIESLPARLNGRILHVDDQYLQVVIEYLDEEVVLFVVDATEAQRQKNSLYQTQKLEALGQLAGGVAHDFNNILSIIDGYNRMIEKRLDADDEALTYTQRIRQSTKRGASLTKQLLAFGHHKTSKIDTIELAAFLDEQGRLLEALLDASVRLIINKQKHVYVDCDRDALGQAIMNVVINARDAIPEDGNVIINMETVPSHRLPHFIPKNDRDARDFVCLSVIDNGSGMDAETKSRIFDPFFTTKKVGKGTGLGLSMVYGVMRDMGGYVDVQSTMGVGTIIKFFLPCSLQAEQGKSISLGTSGDEESIKFNNYTVLLAEDEPDLLEVTAGMLEEMGMSVLRAQNGNDALLVQEEHDGTIDFLVTDVVMPELNGVKLAELMREIRPETKIIMVSGYPTDQTSSRVDIPADQILLGKPVMAEDLARIFTRLLGVDTDRLDGASRGGITQWQAMQR